MNLVKVICYNLFLNVYVHIKVNCYWYNKQELLQKAKEKYHNCGGNGKAAEYYLANKKRYKRKRKHKEAEKKQKENIKKLGMKK